MIMQILGYIFLGLVIFMLGMFCSVYFIAKILIRDGFIDLPDMGIIVLKKKV
jgi:hypothetical protein